MPVFVGAGTSSFMKGDGGVGFSTSTTTIRNALSGVRPGQIIFNHSTGLPEYYNGSSWIAIDSPPVISSVSPTEVDSTAGGNVTFTITGDRFGIGAVVKLISNTGVELTPSPVTRVSATQLTAVIARNSFVNAQEPYDVKVLNASGLSSVLADQINVDSAPTWSTSAGTVATILDNATGTHATLSATDADGDTIAYSISSGSLPGGLSLNSSTGAISGDPTDVTSSTTSSFNARATANSKTADRSFSIIVNPLLDGTSAGRAFSSISAFAALNTLSSVGYYDRWTTLGGAVTAFQQKLYYDGTDTWYVTSPVKSGDGGMMNGSAFGYQESPPLGAFKAIANGQNHSRTATASGVWNYIIGNQVANLIGVSLSNSSGSQGSHPTGDSESSPIDLVGNQTSLEQSWQALEYYNHSGSTNYTTAQKNALRNVVTELNYKTAWMCITGDDDGQGTSNYSSTHWDNSTPIYANSQGGTPATIFFKDVNGSTQKLMAGQSNTNEHMAVTLWTHNNALLFGSGGVNTFGNAGTGSYTNGMKTTSMIMPDQFNGEVGQSSTCFACPLYNSTIGRLNSRNVLLYK